jgi:NADPH-dependent curcumin reductase CurA
MATTMNRRWLLAAPPTGEGIRLPLPRATARAGRWTVLVRTLYIAFEPAIRGWMEDRPSYIRRSSGEVMRSVCVGQIVESEAPQISNWRLFAGG